MAIAKVQTSTVKSGRKNGNPTRSPGIKNGTNLLKSQSMSETMDLIPSGESGERSIEESQFMERDGLSYSRKKKIIGRENLRGILNIQGKL